MIQNLSGESSAVGRQTDYQVAPWRPGADRMAEIAALAGTGKSTIAAHRAPGWVSALQQGLGHQVHSVEARRDGQLVGWLPLVDVRTPWFGRFLVSLPYANSGGVLADSPEVAAKLIDRAVELADRLNVRHLELRHEIPHAHPALGDSLTSKVHMRMPLPDTEEALWDFLKASVRNQIRKGLSNQFEVVWGEAALPEFYQVFARNMRDLGTPVFSRRLFAAMVEHLGADVCVLRDAKRPIAGAILVHDGTRTEVPSASALREYRASNANMHMYWELLKRAVARGSREFDFGRCTEGTPLHRFKKQWKADGQPAHWQYYVRTGEIGEMRPESPKYRLMIAAWKRLPVWVSCVIGPPIVRGIP